MKLLAAILVLFITCTVIAEPDLRTSAVDLGRKIDEARQNEITDEVIEALLGEVSGLRETAQVERINREAAAGEDEQRLEALYRSPVWNDIGFTLAAMRYWRSWLLLDRHRISATPGDLEEAQRGFQTTLALIVYPGLARGSWLGLGYTALAVGKIEMARSWFDRVAMTEIALAKHARNELELLDTMETETEIVLNVTLTPEQADELENQALALLQRHSKHLDGASRAAERLLNLEQAGELSLDRVLRLLRYRDEIIGHHIGPMGFLVSAENALAHQQYYSATEKYRSFFKDISESRAIEFADFRLQYIRALLGADLTEQALAQLDRIRDEQVSDPSSFHQLRFVATARLYAQGGSSSARQSLASQAVALGKMKVARFVSALFSGKPPALQSIDLGETWMVQIPVFELVYQEYQREPQPDAKLAALGAGLYKKLDKETQRSPWVMSAEAHMQGALVTDTESYLATLNKLGGELPGEFASRLFSARIEYQRYRAPEYLAAELAALDSVNDDQMNILLQHLMGCEVQSWCLPVTRVLTRLAEVGSDAHLFATLQQIRVMDDELGAFQLASQLAWDYPSSGDALNVFAETASKAGRTGDAEAAYARLAESLPIGSDQWRVMRLRQIDLRVRAGATEGICSFHALAYGDEILMAAINKVTPCT